MRRNASVIGRLVAGMLLALGLTLFVASAAGAQTNSNTNTNTNTNTNSSSSSTSSSSTVAASTTGTSSGGSLSRTGADLWIPLTVGGVTVLIALAARKLSRAGVL